MKLEARQKRVITIIQARMGSSRFPKKMMSFLNEKPLIEWVIKRCKKSQETTEVVLSTSNLERDDVLVSKASELGIGFSRDDEDNVLKRFSLAAKKYNADTVVRVCGDRPLVDPELIDMAIKEYNLTGNDLVYNHIAESGQNWPRGFGVEVFSAKLLHWMDDNLDSSYHREHVTPYIWENQDKYVVSPVKCPADIGTDYGDLRFDVDEPEDLDHLTQLCKGLDLNVKASQIVERWSTTLG